MRCENRVSEDDGSGLLVDYTRRACLRLWPNPIPLATLRYHPREAGVSKTDNL